MNRRQLLSLPLLAVMSLSKSEAATHRPDARTSYQNPRAVATFSPVRMGTPKPPRIIIWSDTYFATGMSRMSEAELWHWQEQLQMARQDPDYIIITSYQVSCQDPALKGRIVSVPGATDNYLRAVRDQVDRYMVSGARA